MQLTNYVKHIRVSYEEEDASEIKKNVADCSDSELFNLFKSERFRVEESAVDKERGARIKKNIGN